MDVDVAIPCTGRRATLSLTLKWLSAWGGSNAADIRLRGSLKG
jgi:hypothetical protein